MSDFVEGVFGAAGSPLPDDAAELVNDADAATVFEQGRWLRGGLMVTVAGHLVRRADLGHTLGASGRCGRCGESWPCRSRALEVEASQLVLALPAELVAV